MIGWMRGAGLRGRMMRVCLGAGTGLAILGAAGACDDEAERTFRAAAADSLQAGVMAILDGLTTGAFAVFDLGTENNGVPTETTDTTTTSTETSSASAQP